ncbi:MULTIDRUG RESISTANCE PROTEIN [Salix koriyanagi]|uniref:MULTIDRUG RESISTANCE PROTEIN n=1 Tax=Salix koriyanagi TaxID=2511006 RepID=A0A9Q0VZ37_9ROSI|nr:MULTIDRUG RESISTANCE PROTEIN [Salix koriyanagi]
MGNSTEERLPLLGELDGSDLKKRVWNESKKLWKIAFPGMIARVTSFGMIVIGMSSATETLCGQAYGAGHYHMMGVYLQRSWIIDGVTATILLPPLHFYNTAIKTNWARGGYSNRSWKNLPLQKNKIVGWFSASSFVVHVLLSWLFVIKLGFGLAGAMSAFIISSYLLLIGEFVYIFGGWCPNTWKGFTKAAFADMFPLIKLSISSGIMIW